MERFDLTSPGFKGNLMAKFAGSRFGICGAVPVLMNEPVKKLAAIYVSSGACDTDGVGTDHGAVRHCSSD